MNRMGIGGERYLLLSFVYSSVGKGTLVIGGNWRLMVWMGEVAIFDEFWIWGGA